MAAHAPSPLATEPTPPQSAPILVVDDNHINQMLVVTLLKKRGYRAELAADGQQAVTAHARQQYALIFMDCQMPVMDGFDATRAIREAERPSGRHTPIIAITANAMPGDRERCLACGMDDYLSKPFYPEAFIATLQRWAPQPGPARLAQERLTLPKS
jgi:CheY-like chemotaxis protein